MQNNPDSRIVPPKPSDPNRDGTSKNTNTLSNKPQSKRISHNSSNSPTPSIRLNDPKDAHSIIQEASNLLQQHILQQQKKLQQKKKHATNLASKAHKLAEQERMRSIYWQIPSEELKYYLQQQIKIFTAEIELQNDQSKQQFDELIHKISEVLQRELSVQIMVYGSYATRLCLKQSDIDVVVVPAKDSDPTKDLDHVALLEQIDRTLQTLEFVSSTKFIKSASIPVIKVSCSVAYKNKRIDITYQDSNHNGMKCVDIIRRYMNYYKQLRPMTFVLKTLIYSSNLEDTYQGGLSSYGLILMIVSFLQKQYYLKKPDDQPMVSQLLIKFLKFFGLEFDYINKGLYVEHPDNLQGIYKGFYFGVADPNIYLSDVSPKLIIWDPLNEYNIVGKSTHQIRHIQMAFCISYTTIHTNYSCRSPDCRYRQLIEEAQLPKKLGNISQSSRPRPCCILGRMFECSKMFM